MAGLSHGHPQLPSLHEHGALRPRISAFDRLLMQSQHLDVIASYQTP